MFKNIFKILAVFVIGAIGGIFADQILWPYFIERPLFYEYRLEQAPVYVTERKEIIIQENTALTEAVEKVGKAVIGVKAKTKRGEILEGSGLIISSDGLIVSLAELLPLGSDFSFFIDGKQVPFQIIKRDPKQNLVLIKVEEQGLSTISFADLEKIKLGERVFLVGKSRPQNKNWMVNEGIIKTFNKNYIQTNIFEKTVLNGSSLFNIKGEVLGLNIISSVGEVNTIPISKIKSFAGF